MAKKPEAPAKAAKAAPLPTDFKGAVLALAKSGIANAPDTDRTFLEYKSKLLSILGGEIKLVRDDAQTRPSPRLSFTITHRKDGKEQSVRVYCFKGEVSLR